MTSSICDAQAPWFVVFTVFGPVLPSRNDPGYKYLLEKYLTENIEEIWANSFKIRAIGNRDKRAIVGTSHFSDELVYVSPKCVSVWTIRK